MESQPTEQQIKDQHDKVFGPTPYAKLLRPCKLNDGIIRIEEDEQRNYVRSFERNAKSIAFFIPASGSGSRMFEFLYEYKNGDSNELNGTIEQFFNSLSEFAFFRQLPEDFQNKVKNQEIDIDEIIDVLLNENGLDLGNNPKGLIPFHTVGPFILNPFQEHLIQGTYISETKPKFHFTIQRRFESKIKEAVQNATAFTGSSYEVTFLEQSIDTDSIAFNSQGEPYRDSDGSILTRPSGHGALLGELNKLTSELIFIKNIDNVQHFSRSEESNRVLKLLGGILLEYRMEAQRVFETPSINDLLELNNKYQLFDRTFLESVHGSDSIREILDRPTRVCGMVKNEGQPGGGPFWVDSSSASTKQIVEKAQISGEHEQRNILLRSTHFNPVMIAASVQSFNNKKFDLLDYRDNDSYFIVHKTNEGDSINYLEQPGLWNGGMAKWNTIFVEIPNDAFSPVKTVTDLLNQAHRSV